MKNILAVSLLSFGLMSSRFSAMAMDYDAWEITYHAESKLRQEIMDRYCVALNNNLPKMHELNSQISDEMLKNDGKGHQKIVQLKAQHESLKQKTNALKQEAGEQLQDKTSS